MSSVTLIMSMLKEEDIDFVKLRQSVARVLQRLAGQTGMAELYTKWGGEPTNITDSATAILGDNAFSTFDIVALMIAMNIRISLVDLGKSQVHDLATALMGLKDPALTVPTRATTHLYVRSCNFVLYHFIY